MIDSSSTEQLPDDQLIRRVSEALVVCRDEHDSFLLHAPLELLARADLLGRTSSQARARARARLQSVADQHESRGRAFPLLAPETPPADPVGALVDAIAAGDVDSADRRFVAVATRLPVAELCAALAAPTLGLVAAAGHAPILLGNWPRTAAKRPVDPRFARGTIRRLAETASLRFAFPAPHYTRHAGTPADLDAALRALPPLGSPGFGIFSLVQQAEQSGLLETLPAVSADAIDEAFRTLFRVAVDSMLLGAHDAAPYHWTHCLSLPMGLWQSARHHADPLAALDVAITHVLAFRIADGDGALARYAPARIDQALEDALDDTPEVAAAAAYHAAHLDSTVTRLADAAATGHDAHLVKYAHACLDARAADPEHAASYLAATAHLIAWWRQHPAEDDPLR